MHVVVATGYRAGPKVRNCGRISPVAKTVSVPSGVTFKISPTGRNSTTKRLPSVSKATSRGFLRSVTKVLSMPPGVNLRIASLPPLPAVDTKRLPALSKASPWGNWSDVKAPGPAKTVRVPLGVNLNIV